MADGDIDDLAEYGSIVRNNLMKRPGYAPYCGAVKKVGDDYKPTGCSMPRTLWDGEQFGCRCGFRTEFDEAFIAGFKARWPDREPFVRSPD